jgi:hypothetical protein
VDWRRLRVADVAEDRSGDRCHEIARTPDHRFLWTSSSPEDGAVLCTATAECQLLLSTMGLEHAQARTLTERGLVGPAQDGDERLEGPPPEGWRDEPEPDAMAAVAIARAADAELWTILDAWCGVSVDGELRFRLPLIPAASAFSADARRLAAATAGQLVVVDVERPALLRRYDLRPLAATLAPPRPAGLDEALWSRLLVDFGGAEAIAAADDAALLARRGIGPAKLRALRILSYETAPQRLVERLSTD